MASLWWIMVRLSTLHLSKIADHVLRGSTLSLAYSQTHPDRCKGLILRGIFLLRRAELEFFYQEGTSCKSCHLGSSLS
jgi:hypothetical protein